MMELMGKLFKEGVVLKLVQASPNETDQEEWDPNEYQGRSRQQVESSQRVVVWLFCLTIPCVSVWVLFKFFIAIISHLKEVW
jgi:hypothetical protein